MSITFGKWDASIHDEFEQVKRIESARKLSKDIVEINKEEKLVKIQGSAGEPYFTTEEKCNCVDFSMRGLPCKHMYCLEFELGNMDGLPVYKKKKSTFDSQGEIDKMKELYVTGEITADTYAKICTVLSKIKK